MKRIGICIHEGQKSLSVASNNKYVKVIANVVSLCVGVGSQQGVPPDISIDVHNNNIETCGTGVVGLHGSEGLISIALQSLNSREMFLRATQ